MKRSIALLLLCLTLLSSATLGLVSCKKEPEKNKPNNDTAGETEEESAPDEYKDLVKVDYSTDGQPAEFNIVNVSTGWSLDFMDSEDITLQFDSAVYSRNRFIEEQLGIVITAKSVVNSEITGIIRSAESSGDYVYDVCYDETYRAVRHAQAGYFVPVENLTYCDFDKPWWYQDLNETMTIAGSSYTFFGDANMSANDATWYVVYNAQIMEDRGFSKDYIYDLVDAGDWTFEAMYQIANETYVEGSTYGLVSNYRLPTALINAAGLTYVQKNNEGIYQRAELGEQFTSVYLDMLKYFFEDNSVSDGMNAILPTSTTERYATGGFTDWNFAKPFFDGNATFLSMYTGSILRVNLTQSTLDYGIVPMPKYSSQQAKYITQTYYGAMVGSVPYQVQQQGEETLDRVSNVLEWLQAYSYNSTRPVYYDIVLEGRVAKHPRTVDMLHIIHGFDERGTRLLDMNDVLALGLGGRAADAAFDNVTGVTARLRQYSEIVDDKLNTVVINYQKYQQERG
ncbi:MAG: hypothetical protein IJW55_06870 [Clostridia bacterium]|nr:hypothetical protein [Clostridia bacterium]